MLISTLFECELIAFGTVVIVQSTHWNAGLTIVDKNVFRIALVPFLLVKRIGVRRSIRPVP